MKWFIFVIMLGTYNDGTNDTYLYVQPTFETLEQCQQYVYENSTIIRQNMWNEYDGKPIDRVFCIEENKLKQFLQLKDSISV